jgi:hypothetical protein
MWNNSAACKKSTFHKNKVSRAKPTPPIYLEEKAPPIRRKCFEYPNYQCEHFQFSKESPANARPTYWSLNVFSPL